MSEIVDFFLQPYLPTMPSFINDTDEISRRIHNIIDFPSDVLLVTLVVVLLLLLSYHRRLRMILGSARAARGRRSG